MFTCNDLPWPRTVAFTATAALQALNIASASGIVFANKLVMSNYGFGFTCCLTWIHTMFTLVRCLRAGIHIQ